MLPYLNPNISYFARTNFRKERKLFGILQKDRLVHTYIIGKTGVGKTNLLHTLLLQDIQYHRGCALFDVHGDYVEAVYQGLTEEQKRRVIYLNLPDNNMRFGLNPLANVPYEKRSFVAASILEIFHNLWKSAWGVRLEYILRFALLALLDQGDADFSCIRKLITNKGYRATCYQNMVDQEVKDFWKHEFERYSKNDVLPVLNKIGSVLAHPVIRSFLVENKHTINLRSVIDSDTILLINLSKGALGSEVAHILGSIILTSLSQAAFSRIDTPKEQRKPFYVYCDEFQTYTNSSLIVHMLSELRKFHVGMIMAHQYISQLSHEIRDAVLGNVGTVISFRVGLQDAKILEHIMYPVFTVDDIINLPNYAIYLTLLINGKPSKAFSADTIHHLEFPLLR